MKKNSYPNIFSINSLIKSQSLNPANKPELEQAYGNTRLIYNQILSKLRDGNYTADNYPDFTVIVSWLSALIKDKKFLRKTAYSALLAEAYEAWNKYRLHVNQTFGYNHVSLKSKKHNKQSITLYSTKNFPAMVKRTGIKTTKFNTARGQYVWKIVRLTKGEKTTYKVIQYWLNWPDEIADAIAARRKMKQAGKKKVTKKINKESDNKADEKVESKSTDTKLEKEENK